MRCRSCSGWHWGWPSRGSSARSSFPGTGSSWNSGWTSPSGSRFACPECGRAGCGAYDSTERTWRHLNFFQHKTLLHARQPRVECPDHGVKTVEVPWSRPGSGFTLLMEAFILMLVQGGMTPRRWPF
ncbi:MAG: transposase family protein [Phycisphaerales bacterium]|nr:transposase family protein [Phycisphaerales bacterium]